MAYYECGGTANDVLLLKISVQIWATHNTPTITPYEYIIYKNKTWYYDTEIGRAPFNSYYNGTIGWVSSVEFLSNTQIKLTLGLHNTSYSAAAVSISDIINKWLGASSLDFFVALRIKLIALLILVVESQLS